MLFLLPFQTLTSGICTSQAQRLPCWHQSATRLPATRGPCLPLSRPPLPCPAPWLELASKCPTTRRHAGPWLGSPPGHCRHPVSAPCLVMSGRAGCPMGGGRRVGCCSWPGLSKDFGKQALCVGWWREELWPRGFWDALFGVWDWGQCCGPGVVRYFLGAGGLIPPGRGVRSPPKPGASISPPVFPPQAARRPWPTTS